MRTHECPVPCTVNGRQAGWVRARLGSVIKALSPIVSLTGLSIKARVERSALLPERSFANSVPLDLSKDFYPFGEQPRLNDAFYLTLPDEAAKPNATITISITPSHPAPVPIRPSADLCIAWEVWDGTTWQERLKSDVKTPGPETFTGSGSGTVKLTLPAQLAQRLINGVTGCWLRTRIMGGNYGTPLHAVVTNEDKTVTMEGGYGPPSLAALQLAYTAEQQQPVDLCYAYNNWTFVGLRAAFSQPGGPAVPLFTASAEKSPALYLGFNAALANRPMTLYVHVDAPRPGEVAQAMATARQALPPPPQVRWEYASAAQDWTPLGAVDETNAFANSGEVRFLGPADATRRRVCGQELFWLRARLDDGTPPRAPPATCGAHQHHLGHAGHDAPRRNAGVEHRGSTAGLPHAPGARLARPASERPGACPPLCQRAGGAAGAGRGRGHQQRAGRRRPRHDLGALARRGGFVRVRAAGPPLRYRVLESDGEIRFGDGQHGMIPPVGPQTIRMAYYRTGGGAQGNGQAAASHSSKPPSPLWLRVTNHAAAEGGADEETLAQVQERGPQALRHRGRAVTAQDIVGLAYEATPEVARAHVLTPRFDPIALGWLRPMRCR